MSDPTPKKRKVHALPDDLQAERLVRVFAAATMLGVARSTLYRMVSAGKLPPPRRLAHRVAGWSLRELRDFMGNRAA